MAFTQEEKTLWHAYLAGKQRVTELEGIVSEVGKNASPTNAELAAADRAVAELPAARSAEQQAWDSFAASYASKSQ